MEAVEILVGRLCEPAKVVISPTRRVGPGVWLLEVLRTVVLGPQPFTLSGSRNSDPILYWERESLAIAGAKASWSAAALRRFGLIQPMHETSKRLQPAMQKRQGAGALQDAGACLLRLRRFQESMKNLWRMIWMLGVASAMADTSTDRDITNSIGMKLVRIERGSFLMGQDGPSAD